MRQASPTPRRVLALALVLLLCACGRAVCGGHRCIHDELARRQAREGVAVVRTGNVTAGMEVYEVQRAVGWSPLRIGVFTLDLDIDSGRYCSSAGTVAADLLGRAAVCTVDDVLTPSKNATIIEKLIPAAVALHTERLQVQRDGEDVLVPRYPIDTLCGQFNVPEEHHRIGVYDTDFVLYVSASPLADNDSVLSQSCMRTSTDRPLVGVLNVSPRFITDDRRGVRVVARGMLGALGFNKDSFEKKKYIIDALGPPNLPALKGFSGNLAVTEASYYFQCFAVFAVPLSPSRATAPQLYWKQRYMSDDLMAENLTTGYYSNITMSVMEDLGYYKVDYSKAEEMTWGRGVGCGLFETCVKDGVSPVPSMFCADTTHQVRCSVDRRSLQFCNVVEYKEDLPEYYQYFSNPKLGGNSAQLDYCPSVISVPLSSCAAADLNIVGGNELSPQARCFDAIGPVIPNGTHGTCAAVQCDSVSHTYTVKFKETSTFVECSHCEKMPIQTGGMFGSTIHYIVTCPSYEEVCGGEGVDPSSIKQCGDAALRSYGISAALLVAVGSVVAAVL